MNFLIDQDVYRATIEFLIGLGHNVVTAQSLGFNRASDRDILKKSIELDRILILVFLEKTVTSGIIFLRITPTTLSEAHSELRRLLVEHSEAELKVSYCTVESDRHRIRKLKLY